MLLAYSAFLCSVPKDSLFLVIWGFKYTVFTQGKNLWVLDALEDWIYIFSAIKLAYGQMSIFKPLKRKLSLCGFN